MEMGSMAMFASGYTGPRQRPMQIFIGSAHILLISVSVSMSMSGSVKLGLTIVWVDGDAPPAAESDSPARFYPDPRV